MDQGTVPGVAVGDGQLWLLSLPFIFASLEKEAFPSPFCCFTSCGASESVFLDSRKSAPWVLFFLE